MNLYFSLIGNNYYTDKNKLHKEAKKVALEFSHNFFNETELADFKKNLKKRIQELNEKHHQCNPLTLYEHRGYHDGCHLYLSVSGVFSLSIYDCSQYASGLIHRDPALDLMGDMKADSE